MRGAVEVWGTGVRRWGGAVEAGTLRNKTLNLRGRICVTNVIMAVRLAA